MGVHMFLRPVACNLFELEPLCPTMCLVQVRMQANHVLAMFWEEPSVLGGTEVL